MAVTNIWHVLNLRESPFFQAELEAEGRYPTELFVGRRDEIAYVLAGIGGAPDSRHAIQGGSREDHACEPDQGGTG